MGTFLISFPISGAFPVIRDLPEFARRPNPVESSEDVAGRSIGIRQGGI
jgi:hypothetical protein